MAPRPPTLASAPAKPWRCSSAIEITLHGRGGQGAQVACQILAEAFFRSGHWVQAFAAYGGERRGAPVRACLRADDEPIRVRSDVERPHGAIVLDATLIPPIVETLVRPDGLIVVNGAMAPCGSMPPGARVVAVDLTDIARRAGLGAIVGTAALGAFVGATALITLDVLLAAVEAGSPRERDANVKACREAYADVAALAFRETVP